MSSSSQRYISNELTHFVGRGLAIDAQYKIFQTILSSGFLSHPPHDRKVVGNLFVNPDAKLSKNEMFLPQIVCFCDIPIEDLDIHISKYSPFGIAFEKDLIAQNGGAPVFYIPVDAKVRSQRDFPFDIMNRVSSSNELQEFARQFNKAQYFDWMVGFYIHQFDEIEQRILEDNGSSGAPDELHAIGELQRLFNFHILSHIKFFDHNLPDDHPENFYFEREWRLLGNLNFNLDDVTRVILPKAFARDFRRDQPEYYGQITFSDLPIS
jgi:hypothetical protein